MSHAAASTWRYNCITKVETTTSARLTGVASQDAAVAQAASLQHKQQLGEQPLQLVDGAALHSRALKPTFNQAPPHRLQPACKWVKHPKSEGKMTRLGSHSRLQTSRYQMDKTQVRLMALPHGLQPACKSVTTPKSEGRMTRLGSHCRLQTSRFQMDETQVRLMASPHCLQPACK